MGDSKCLKETSASSQKNRLNDAAKKFSLNNRKRLID